MPFLAASLYIAGYYRTPMADTGKKTDLLKRISELETENAMLKRDFSKLQGGSTVKVPDAFKPLFDIAQQTVGDYFRQLSMHPAKGTIEINDERYILISASALAKDFLETIQKLYADRGEAEAFAIGKNFLFDIAHVIGMNDAKKLHTRMNLTDPVAKLSAGPVHFAYTGWAFVDILPESNPTPDDNFYLIYNHPYSFEADTWVRAGKRSSSPVCIMNAGYSSGWCEESFGIPLTAVEVSCVAKGDKHCTFIMSPPHKIQEHLERFHQHGSNQYSENEQYEIPTFFERKKVEEEMQRSRRLAEESAKSKADFVANMSHELRTPLGAILGFTDLLQKTELTTVQKDYLQAISKSGKSLLSIINDILDLSKMDAGKFNIEHQPFNIPQLLHSVQVMFADKAKKKQLHFVCSADTSINYAVSGDPMRLTQILVNLIGNAIKFTTQGGVYVNCLVDAEDEEHVTVLFSIRDTGIGIAADMLHNVFERFIQADSNITRRYGGTGLGLAITKQLIELQGGNISVQSEEGKGTEFTFTIPLQKCPEQSVAADSDEFIQALHFGTLRDILVAEDNLMNQKLATIILQNNGFTVTLADNGGRAIELLKDRSFDLILMDIQMPVLDGYQATQVIRNELHIATPIIAMTAHALAGEKEKCLQTGMNDYLAKPFKESTLLMKIAACAAEKDVPADEQAYEGKPVIDLSFLIQQTKNNRTFIEEMIRIFIGQNPGDIAALHDAINKADFPAIYRIAHGLHNTIGFFGLNNVIGNELMEIEKLSRLNKDITEIKACFTKVKFICGRAVTELTNSGLPA